MVQCPHVPLPGNALYRSIAFQQGSARPGPLTDNRHRFFADPVTCHREALQSLQEKNSLYPTLK